MPEQYQYHRCKSRPPHIFCNTIRFDLKNGWNMNVNDEYDEPILYCPYCGVKLECEAK